MVLYASFPTRGSFILERQSFVSWLPSNCRHVWSMAAAAATKKSRCSGFNWLDKTRETFSLTGLSFQQFFHLLSQMTTSCEVPTENPLSFISCLSLFWLVSLKLVTDFYSLVQFSPAQSRHWNREHWGWFPQRTQAHAFAWGHLGRNAAQARSG